MKYIHSVQQAIDYIEAHLDEPLALQQIAGRAYVSLPHLYRAFYSLTGHPIKEYIRKRRIHMAAMHLRHSGKPVWDIALDCGFDSYQAFTKMFKKVVGMTPGAYRNADLYYSFEAVNLLADVTYTADNELFARYPDVSVIRFPPLPVAVYRRCASSSQGIEEDAFRIVFAKLEQAGWPMERIRLFGTNVERASRTLPHGYDVMVPLPADGKRAAPDDFRITTFPGGLYAVGKCAETSEPLIVATWDRLLSEWLPRSTFELGDHAYVEEFLTYQGSITRLKLYLPVKRKQEPSAALETLSIAPFAVVACRAFGPDARGRADHELSAWLLRAGMTGMPQMRLYMSYSYGVEPDEGYWYELGVAIPEEVSIPVQASASCATAAPNSAPADCSRPDGFPAGSDPLQRIHTLGGGMYACLTSGAYGLMSGLLEKMHRWLYANENYALDEKQAMVRRIRRRRRG
ncbi:HTH-type transcriptional activator RhaR [Paenibacillus solanacearum]|uniref:HTH-type transcriptional activator RhaR n=1 Tax=Paenibacillus solanacearum TaxID=2048548 RepID=A0A916NIA1_9BACL|nr:AraC family transcriptional regulator [Paenibacillus solanacearum]CAG7619769.1 HTH-type transcriptional activator RhaR [Paenibacillus solanacearum]